MNDNIVIHYYSERGLVDFLITWLKYEASKDELKKFFKMINVDFDDIIRINIYNEFSFGEFGSPDLIIKISTKTKTQIFLLEAKIDSFVKSATKKEDKNIYKGNASKINIQLMLRKKFITILNKDSERLFLEENGYTSKNGRALDKKELVQWSKNELKNADEYFYVALVRYEEDKEKIWNDYFNFKNLDSVETVLEQKEFLIISWKNVYFG